MGFSRKCCFPRGCIRALYHGGPNVRAIMTASQCEFDWNIDMLSSSCELDRHIRMLWYIAIIILRLWSLCSPNLRLGWIKLLDMHITIEEGLACTLFDTACMHALLSLTRSIEAWLLHERSFTRLACTLFSTVDPSWKHHSVSSTETSTCYHHLVTRC